MDKENSFPLDDNMLNTLSLKNLNLIKARGDEMDEAMAKAMDIIKSQLYTGSSNNDMVTANINGQYQLSEISINELFSDWTNDQTKTLSLITEAINDAIYKVDLDIETTLSTIEYQFLGKAIEDSSFPIDKMEHFRKIVSTLKKK